MPQKITHRLGLALALALAGLSQSALATSTPATPGTASKTTIQGSNATLRTVVGNVRCPSSINAEATNAPQPWMPSAVTMNVVNAKLSDQPLPQQQMLCFYEGSGSKWYIGRNIQPGFQSCTVASKSSFTCQN
jgi:hypothetical protein